MAESDWPAFDREWCTQAQPWRQALQKSGGLLTTDTARQVDLPALNDEALADLGSQLLQRTARALSARGSPRERAVGLWLSGKGEELMAEAEATRDPVVVALAAQRLTGPLRERAIRLWHAVEPGNAAALLYLQALEPAPTAQLFDALARASSHDTHLPAVFQIVLSVPPPTADSPSALALHVALVGLHAAFPLPELRPLIQPCKRPESAVIAQQCAQVAERLWALQPNDTLMPRLVLAMVRAQPALHPAWASRAERVEAVAHLESTGLEATLTTLTQRMVCLPQAQDRDPGEERLRAGDWAYWSSRLPNDPAAVAALSERYRQANKGKGLLSPRP